jgi:flagellar biogenesis protein FliO
MWEQILAIFVVLALLMSSLWLLRHKALGGVTLLKAKRANGARRLELLERISLSPNHVLHLVRVEGRTMLIAVSPSGCVSIDTASALPDNTAFQARQDSQS